jgi:hypothetical protein
VNILCIDANIYRIQYYSQNERNNSTKMNKIKEQISEQSTDQELVPLNRLTFKMKRKRINGKKILSYGKKLRN